MTYPLDKSFDFYGGLFFKETLLVQAKATEADRKKLPKLFEIEDSLLLRAMG